MSSQIVYQGNFLGRIHLSKINSKGDYSWVLVMKNLNCLETLLKLSSSDELLIDDKPKLYIEFQKEVLEKTSTIYPSLDTYIEDNIIKDF